MANDPSTETPGTATETVKGSPDNIPSSFNHPLDPLTPDEVSSIQMHRGSYVCNLSNN